MTIPVSTAPAVKAYLFTQLQANITAASGSSLLVCYDEPGPYEPDDIVSVGDVTARNTAQLAMVGSGGAGWLIENYSLEVVVDCFRGGDDPQTVDERAWALIGQVEAVVRTDPSCGDLVVEARPGQCRSESMWDDAHKGRRVRAAVAVDVQAQI